LRQGEARPAATEAAQAENHTNGMTCQGTRALRSRRTFGNCGMCPLCPRARPSRLLRWVPSRWHPPASASRHDLWHSTARSVSAWPTAYYAARHRSCRFDNPHMEGVISFNLTRVVPRPRPAPVSTTARHVRRRIGSTPMGVSPAMADAAGFYSLAHPVA